MPDFYTLLEQTYTLLFARYYNGTGINADCTLSDELRAIFTNCNLGLTCKREAIKQVISVFGESYRYFANDVCADLFNYCTYYMDVHTTDSGRKVVRVDRIVWSSVYRNNGYIFVIGDNTDTLYSTVQTGYVESFCGTFNGTIY
jgi:hypothetical protein